MNVAELRDYLRANLRIETETKSEYTGSYDGPAYKDVVTIKLMLEGEVISEATP